MLDQMCFHPDYGAYTRVGAENQSALLQEFLLIAAFRGPDGENKICAQPQYAPKSG